MQSVQWYVYAIVGAETSLPPELVGFGGTPLGLVRHRGLAAVVGLAPAADRPDPEFVIEHEEIVEQICRHTRALPARFRTVLRDASAISEALAERYQVLEADLRRIGGHVEMGLYVLLRSQPPPEKAETRPLIDPGTGPGTRYLAARAYEYRRDSADRSRAKAMKKELEAVLRPYLVESRYELAGIHPVVLRASYLTLADRVKAIRSALEPLRASHRHLRFLLSGPWPPYSFVTFQSGIATRSTDGGAAGRATMSKEACSVQPSKEKTPSS